jgi:hypothetical protein
MTNALPSWTIQATVPMTNFVPGQGPVEGYNLTFVTNTSIQGAVFVPITEISNTEKVREIIVARITALANLHGLSG